MEKITQADIEKLEALHKDLEVIQVAMSDQIKTAQDRYNDDEVEIEREGEKVKVKQKHLWIEIQHLGPTGHQAADVMKELHPQIWELFEEEQKKVREVEEFEIATFGFKGRAMKLIDLIHLIQGIKNL